MCDKSNKVIKKKKRKALLVWFLISVILAGFSYLVFEWIHIGFFSQISKDVFYVLNKEAFNGYFYAWSITLVAGTLTSLLLNRRFLHNKRRTICKSFLVVISIGLIVYTLFSYVQYSQKVNSSIVSLVETLNLEKPDYKGCADDFIRKSEVDRRIDAIITSVDTKEFVDRIDKEKLKEALIRYNYEIVNPIHHFNLELIGVAVVSFVFSLLTIVFIYSKPKQRKKEGSK